MVDDDHKEDDDDDGRIARNLFRTESDSSSCRSDEQQEEKEVKESQKEAALAESSDGSTSLSSSSLYVRHEIGNLILETQGAGGGSIAQRLWPAAQHLADFVLEIIKANDDDTQKVQQVEGAVMNDGTEQAQSQPNEPVSSLSSLCQNGKVEASHDDGGVGVSSSSTLTTTTNTTRTHLTGDSTTITTTHCNKRIIQTPCAIQCRTKLEQILLLQDHLYVMELGAGIGLTGLALATNISIATERTRRQQVHVLLTDLDEAMNLLQRNIKQNQSQLLQSSTTTISSNDNNYTNIAMKTVQAQPLQWGVMQDYENAMTWYRRVASISNYKSPESESEISLSSSSMSPHQQSSSCSLLNSPPVSPPILFLGSDLVYWECLYEPLEHALFHLLFQAPMGSICLLAGMRRWKRDTAFYKSLGKRRQNNSTWQLQCTCIREETTTTTTSMVNGIHANDTSENSYHYDQKPDEKQVVGTAGAKSGQQRQREIFRIYIVELVRRR